MRNKTRFFFISCAIFFNRKFALAKAYSSLSYETATNEALHLICVEYVQIDVVTFPYMYIYITYDHSIAWGYVGCQVIFY